MGRAPSPRPRPHRRLRALRLLPADVPELRRLRGGDGLPAGPDRADARRQRGGLEAVGRAARPPRPLPRLHGLRDRLPVRRPVRQADRAGPAAGRAQRAAPSPRAAVPAPDLRALHPPGAAARPRAGAVAATAARPERPDRPAARPRAGAAGDAPARPAGLAPRGDRAASRGHAGARRAARAGGAHAGLREPRVLRRRQRGHRARAQRGGLGGPCPAAPALLRRAAAARRRRARGARAGQGDDRGLRGLRGGRGQRRRLRIGHEGLRAPAVRRPRVGRARRGVLGPGPGRHRAARRRGAAGPAPSAAAAGRLPRRLPSGARAGRPRPAARAAARDPRARAARARGLGVVLRLGGHLQPRATGGRRGARRAQGAQPRRHRRGRRRRRQPGLRAADRRAPGRPRAADPPPDDPAGPLDQRNPPMKLEVAPTGAEQQILTSAAVDFLGELHARFGRRRGELLAARHARAAELEDGATLDFLVETREIRAGDWKVADPPGDYLDRRVEITGPTDRKLVINALNSGASGFMADFEDANSPTWRNQAEGHVNLIDAIGGSITYDSSEGRHYELGENPATLLVRPRGWHLPENHLRVGGDPVAGAFMDFGLYAFHNAKRLLDRGSAPYFYLPKIEHHLEARLWNEVFTFTEQALGIPHGSIRVTVLIETLPAAFQMEEIL